LATAAAIDPEDLWALGSELGYRVEICWSQRSVGRFDAFFTRAADDSAGMPLVECTADPQPWNEYANQPLRAAVSARLGPAVLEFLKSRLPDYMIPSAFMILERLPLTANGKIDRNALPMPNELRPETEVLIAPRNSIEEALAKIWEDLLGVGLIGVNDNFFALGGHSLLAAQVISRIRQSLQIELPLRSMFETPTIAGLAKDVAEYDAKAGRATAVAEMRKKIDSLSPEEIRALLQAKHEVANR
jgi:acyl carrier protein